MNAVLQALKIRPAEVEKALLMASYLLLAVSAFIMGRIARDSLFLTKFSKEDLAYMYISVAIVLPLPAYFYARIADRFRRDKLILATFGLIVVGLLVSRVLVEVTPSAGIVVLYNFVEII